MKDLNEVLWRVMGCERNANEVDKGVVECGRGINEAIGGLLGMSLDEVGGKALCKEIE